MTRFYLSIGLLSLINHGSIYSQLDHDASRRVIEFLASDELKGRAVGSEGAFLAAGFIASELNSVGVKPGYSGNWFQEYHFVPKSAPHPMQSGDSLRLGLGMVKSIECNNVVGFIDNKAKHTVIIGAHYDHLGMGDENSLYTGNQAIHNGADDNASGVAGLITLGRWLAQRPAGTSGHNYCLVAFSGEEKGLVGSKKFVETMPFPKESVAFMLNMDMVGRLNEEGALALNGVGTSPLWSEVLDVSNTDGLKLVKSESGSGPSDHTSFYLENIPVLHFFTGQHEDYHKPSDDADKINYSGMKKVLDFMMRIILAADKTSQPAFTKTVDKSPSSSDFKVTLGVMPDYVYEGEGLRIDGCKEDRPAMKAGLQKGDIILQLGDFKIDDIYNYMEALGKFEKGQTVNLEYRREGKLNKVKVTF